MNVKEIREKLIKFEDYTEVVTTCRHCGNSFMGEVAFDVVDYTNQTFGYINIEMNGRKNKSISVDRNAEVSKKDLVYIINMLGDFGSCDVSQDDKIEETIKIMKKYISQDEYELYSTEIELDNKRKELLEYEMRKKVLNKNEQKEVQKTIKEIEEEIKNLNLSLYNIYSNLNKKRGR